MNRLQHETSPYLLQHAHNPVDWYAWKPEAFERARKEDKPILVSIGYSTCHWCHVMERESFEDEQIAAYMNEHYINIKVDREERPDVDQIYMDACQALTGSGGWPLNCFLLPDGRPFYAGTYYPPQPRYNRPSWQQVLEQMNHHYQHDREKVEEQADRLTESIRRTDTMFIKDELIENSAGEPLFQRSDLTAIYQQLEQRFDREHGGFGGAPKFPGTMNLEFLLRYYHHFDQPEALQHVQFSLTRMIRGGIYDQLGGGFARYATDEAWLVPHFEKMLYDNALLVSLLADVYQVTGGQLYRDTIEDTLGFIEREMTSPEGGFYSALDADSEGEEGKFYVWDKKQIEATLGDDAPLVLDYYGVSEGGNWEGKNILWRPSDEKAFSEKWSISLDELRQRLASAKVRLFTVRALRYRPGLDDKILLDWNSLQVKAYARAAQALENRDYQRKAVDHLEFLLEHLAQEEGPGFYHVYKDGQRQYDAFLNDYAYLIDALIAVYELTLETRYLDRAHTLTEYVIDNFLDRSSNLFYFTSRKQQDILMQRKDLYDSTMPSGNSAMVDNLIRMAIFFERAAYQQLAEQMLARMGDSISKYPASFPNWAMQIFKQVFPVFEIAVVGSNAQTVVHKVHRHYLPNKVIMGSEEPRADFPLLRDKSVLPDTKIYVCQNYSCQLPVSSIQEMLEQLGAHT